MEAVALLSVVVVGVWAAAVARYASLWVCTAAFIALGYVFGPPCWSAAFGPVPLTVDRVLLLGLIAVGAWQWRQGRLERSAMTGFDWLLIATLAYFTLRCAATSAPGVHASSVKPWWKLVAAYWTPAALYATARVTPRSEGAWRKAAWAFVGLGAFLAFTAFAEVGKQWWIVFPRYIADPELGTHFGRARGPALNSASLGVFLTVSFWAAWALMPRASRIGQIGLAATLLAGAGAVYFTYTRSTWLGLAAGMALIPLFQLPPRGRLVAAFGAATLAASCVLAFGERVTDLSRKDTDGSAEHSVYQRASFVYVSLRMFCDAPIFGCGFGRFYDMKIPYLADRSQQLELESLRNLDHHNTFLSVLTETGVVGLGLFLALLVAWTSAALRLVRDPVRESWERTHGLFALATLATYGASALFHDLTLSPTEHWPLFFTAGVSVALLCARQECAAPLQWPSLKPSWSPAFLPPRS